VAFLQGVIYIYPINPELTWPRIRTYTHNGAHANNQLRFRVDKGIHRAKTLICQGQICQGVCEVRLELPSALVLDTILSGDEIRDWCWDCHEASIEVCAPHGPIQHAEPSALAAIAAWATYHRHRGRSIQIHDSVKSPYTWRFGLLSALSGSTENSARATRFLPPTQIASESSIPMEIERTVDLLGLTSQGSRAGVAKSISEAVRNVFEHANAADGAFLCASYFQAADRLSIAVADAGIGVPATIRPRYGSKLSDAEANLLATELKVTGARPSPRYGGAISNAGVGLYYLRTVSFRSKGLFALLSGTAAVRDGGNGLPPTTAPSRAAWKGTVVAVTLSASRADEIMNTTHEIFARGLSGDRKRQIIGFGHPPPGAELITITPTVVGLIEDKAQARRLRDTVILPAIKAGQPVGIDLRAGQLVTHSFTHALLFAAIREAGADAKRLLFVRASTNQVRDTVRLVSWYATNEPDEFMAEELENALDGMMSEK